MAAPSPPAEKIAFRTAVLEDRDLLKHIFKLGLGVEDLCRAGVVCQMWCTVTSAPDFWHDIDVSGRGVTPAQVRSLLERRPQVRRLNLRGVQLLSTDTLALLPPLAALEALELAKASYTNLELECISTSLGALTRLVLAGGHISVYDAAGGPAHNNPPPQQAHHQAALHHIHHQLHLVQQQIAERHAAVQHAQHANLGNVDLGALHAELAALQAQRAELQLQLQAHQVHDVGPAIAGAPGPVAAGAAQAPAPEIPEMHPIGDLDEDDAWQDDIPLLVNPAQPAPLPPHVPGGGAAAAGGGPGVHSTLASPSLRTLELEGGSSPQPLRIDCPLLEELRLHQFTCPNIVLGQAPALARITVSVAPKSVESHLKNLLRIPPGAPVGAGDVQALPALTSLAFNAVPHLSDEIIAACAAGLPAIRSLRLSSCHKLTGAGLHDRHGWRALRSLKVAACDSMTGEQLSGAVNDMPQLRELRVAGCALVTSLNLAAPHLTLLDLSGARALRELEAHCPLLAEVVIAPARPWQPSSPALRRISLRSHAITAICWAKFPALEQVLLRCPNLETLDLSECSALQDSVFASLSATAGGVGSGCRSLRTLRLTNCDSLQRAALSLPALQHVHLASCGALRAVDMDCPSLAAISVEECTALEDLVLATGHVGCLSLGTCTGLTSATLRAPLLTQLDLQGCNLLATLNLQGCDSLLSVDATFCSALSDDALRALAACPCLEELRLSSATAAGVALLSALPALRRLDLSGTYLDDPAPVAAVARGLISLVLSNNWRLRPEALRPVLLALCPTAEAPGSLRELDISYCEVPGDVVAELALRGGLRSLAANGCPHATDALWPLLHSHSAAGGAAGAASTLRTLSLVGCKALHRFYLGTAPAAEAAAHGLAGAGPAGVAAGAAEFIGVATPLTGLTELRLGVCNLTSAAVALPALLSLQLNRCESLATLHLDCPALERLSLASCRRLTPEAVVAMAVSCPALRELDLQDFPAAAAPAAVAALHAACPALQSVLVTQPRALTVQASF